MGVPPVIIQPSWIPMTQETSNGQESHGSHPSLSDCCCILNLQRHVEQGSLAEGVTIAINPQENGDDVRWVLGFGGIQNQELVNWDQFQLTFVVIVFIRRRS